MIVDEVQTGIHNCIYFTIFVVLNVVNIFRHGADWENLGLSEHEHQGSERSWSGRDNNCKSSWGRCTNRSYGNAHIYILIVYIIKILIIDTY